MGIKFFRLSYLDKARSGVSITVTDSVASSLGANSVSKLRNRSDTDGWSTSGSADSGNTTLELAMGDQISFTRILLLNHNLKAYTIKWWDSVNELWQDFNTPIAEANFTEASSYYEVEETFSSKLQIVITGTQVADQDKIIRQILVTSELGEFQTEVDVEPVFDQNISTRKFVSGKNFVSKSPGAMELAISMSSTKRDSDLTLIETLRKVYGGFHVWLCGGTTSQFPYLREGYRKEDIYFMAINSNYSPRWRDGRFKSGTIIDFKMVEVE